MGIYGFLSLSLSQWPDLSKHGAPLCQITKDQFIRRILRSDFGIAPIFQSVH